jgi:AraC family transcriptional regulator
MSMEHSVKDGASSVRFGESSPSPCCDGLARPELLDCNTPLQPQACGVADLVHPVVQISPPDLVERHAMTWHGVTAEFVQCRNRHRIEYRFSAPTHLLIAYEDGQRRSGETFVEGLPPSALRRFERKLTLVPAGHEYYELHEPSAHTRLMFFYFDPAVLKAYSDAAMMDVSFSPRLYFEEPTLRRTVDKLMALLDRPGLVNRRYFEALSIVLTHDLARFNSGLAPVKSLTRGGLAIWQQRIVTAYIDNHLTEHIPLAKLAQLVRLSPHHFCRAFKESLGTPPRRYQMNRRIEHAKRLLADRTLSVTDIGLTLGFCEGGSFTKMFRKTTGLTPRTYHRKFSA